MKDAVLTRTTGRRGSALGFTIIELIITMSIVIVLLGIGVGTAVLMSRGMQLFAFSSQVNALLLKARNDAISEKSTAYFAVDTIVEDGIERQVAYAVGKSTALLLQFEEITSGSTSGYPGILANAAGAELVDGSRGAYLTDYPRGSQYGKVGNCFFFNGQSEIRTPDQPTYSATDGASIEAWVMPFTGQYGSFEPGTILQRAGDYLLRVEADLNIYGQIGPAVLIADNYHLPEYRWTHIAITYDGARITLTANGVEVAGADMTDPITCIGGDVSIGKDFVGLIDEVRLSGFYTDKKYPVPDNAILRIEGAGAAVPGPEGRTSYRLWFDQAGRLDPRRHTGPAAAICARDGDDKFKFEITQGGNVQFVEIN